MPLRHINLNNLEETNNNKAGRPKKLGIYIRKGGIDTLTVTPDGVVRESVAVDAAIASQSKIIEEAVYLTPALLGDYAATVVIADSQRFMVVPECVADDPATLASTAAIMWPDVQSEGLTVDRPGYGCAVISDIDPALTGFVGRTFAKPAVHHRLAALVSFFSLQSHPVNRVKMFAHFSAPNRLDIVAVSTDGLLMANTFECQEATDAMYFIMAAVKDTGFDALDDELLLSGDNSLCEELTQTLRKYVNSVMPLLLPAAVSESPLELQIINH